jgi:hypothetical protein
MKDRHTALRPTESPVPASDFARACTEWRGSKAALCGGFGLVPVRTAMSCLFLNPPAEDECWGEVLSAGKPGSKRRPIGGCWTASPVGRWMMMAPVANKSDPSIGRRRVNGNQQCSPLGPVEASFDTTSEKQALVGPREPPGDGGSWLWSVGEGLVLHPRCDSGAVRNDHRQCGCSRY